MSVAELVAVAETLGSAVYVTASNSGADQSNGATILFGSRGTAKWRRVRQTGETMSFLDNLENNLKSLESQEEGKESAERAHRARENARAQAQAAAPWAEALKKGPFTAELLKQAAVVGFSLKTKVHVAWLGTTLRLEARDRRLELRPTATGIAAVYLENGQEAQATPLDLKGSAEELVRSWLGATR